MDAESTIRLIAAVIILAAACLNWKAARARQPGSSRSTAARVSLKKCPA
jgi:hypothetical protein